MNQQTLEDGWTVGIDASRNRSGGAKTHLRGLMTGRDPRDYGISRVHLWSYPHLLREIPDCPWLTKHSPRALERSLPYQLWWQARHFPVELREADCQVLLSTDAGTICPFKPSVTMSRDMLSFEQGEIDRFGISSARMRLLLLRYTQVASLKRAAGTLFLTQYAADVIQRFSGPLRNVRIIPHGISDDFRLAASLPISRSTPRIRCVYISNSDLYKHQWNVIEAIASLRRDGYPVVLDLVGAGSGRDKAVRRTAEVARRLDLDSSLVRITGSTPHDEIVEELRATNIFIFASSCENMPNTLVEAMSAGRAIASSDRGPMPEVLRDAGVYFDPEKPDTIANAVRTLIDAPAIQTRCATRAKALSDVYSWSRCAGETWRFLADVAAEQWSGS